METPVNRDLVYALRRVSERAACAAFNWIGRGDADDGGRAALDAMRSALAEIDIESLGEPRRLEPGTNAACSRSRQDIPITQFGLMNHGRQIQKQQPLDCSWMRATQSCGISSRWCARTWMIYQKRLCHPIWKYDLYTLKNRTSKNI